MIIYKVSLKNISPKFNFIEDTNLHNKLLFFSLLENYLHQWLLAFHIQQALGTNVCVRPIIMDGGHFLEPIAP